MSITSPAGTMAIVNPADFTTGFLRQTPSGKWAGVLKYRDACGQWRQVTKTLTRDRAESEAMFAAWRAGMRGGIKTPDLGQACCSPTVEGAVRECLDAQLARGCIERSTHHTQLAVAKRTMFCEFGELTLADLKPPHLQAWIDRLCLQLAPGSVRIAYSLLHKACAREVLRGRLARNPMEHVEAPARTRPARAFLPAPAVALLERELDERWGPADWRTCGVRLALYAGLRVGECCALRWRDVDLYARRLSVVASVGRSAGGLYLKPPKCAASAREFPIVSALACSLETRSAICGNVNSADFVCGDGGSFANPRSLSAAFARLCERAGVADNNGRRATFHVLRHTFATRAVRAGVDVRTLADLMGHARADVTLNVYAASGEDAKLAAVARMEGAGT